MLILLTGILLIINGLLTLYFGDRPWRGTIIPAWTAWPEMILGAAVCLAGIWYLRRKKGQPKERIYTDAELAQSEAEADALYFREHGEMPQKPPKDEAAPDSQHQGP